MEDQPLSNEACSAAEQGATFIEKVLAIALEVIGIAISRFTASVQMGRRYLHANYKGRDFMITIEDAEIGGRARAREMKHDFEMRDENERLKRELAASKSTETLTPGQWGAFCDAERYVYSGDGEFAFSDVNTILESGPLVPLWEQAQITLENTETGWDSYADATKNALIARRVARGWAVVVFGPEFIMK